MGYGFFVVCCMIVYVIFDVVVCFDMFEVLLCFVFLVSYCLLFLGIFDVMVFIFGLWLFVFVDVL